MSGIITQAIELYTYLNYDIADPRTNKYFLIRSPFTVIALIVLYVRFILNYGPRLMANRPQLKLERIMQLYDFIQIISNGYLFYKALIVAWMRHYKFVCEQVDYSNRPEAVQMADITYAYFLIKILDLVDTLFIVLRKKDRQASFLHLYHHSMMVVTGWTGAKYIPGGHMTMLGLVNLFVHTVMYTHYLVMSFKVFNPWWKKYITQLQIAQFLFLFIHIPLILRKDCEHPKWPVYVFVPQNLLMIYLFSSFYYQNYIKPTHNLKSH